MAKYNEIWKKYHLHKSYMNAYSGQSILLCLGEFTEEIRKGLYLSSYFPLRNTRKLGLLLISLISIFL